MINNINSVSQIDNNNNNNNNNPASNTTTTNSYFANMTSNAINSSSDNSKSYYNCDSTSTTKIQPAPIHSSIAIQMDSEVSRTASTISIKRNIKNYFEFKEKLGTYANI